MTGTSYGDSLNLSYGITYYYVVRAVENGVEESNTVQKGSVVSGTLQVATAIDTTGIYASALRNLGITALDEELAARRHAVTVPPGLRASVRLIVASPAGRRPR